jgi:lysophospholipase L1-like esterase
MTEDQLLPAEANDPYLLSAGGAALLLRGAPWTRFAAVGDSGAAGVTEALAGYACRTWFDRVADRLAIAQPALVRLNLGRRDATAARVTAEQLEPALEFAPDLAAVLSGGNDILRRQFDADATAADIATVVSALRDAGSTVVMTGLFDITNSPGVAPKYRQVMSERIARLSGVIAAIARESGALYVDLPAHPAGAEAIYGSDGLHLNSRGQAILATEVLLLLGRGCHRSASHFHRP